jgi:hypothetical protein
MWTWEISAQEISSGPPKRLHTPVGPLTLGFATTTADSHTVWISFGRPIAEGTILSRGIFR